jgi:hypothetical protein
LTPEVNYWFLRNKDVSMHRFAKERVQLICGGFFELVEKYCKGSYEDLYSNEQRLEKKSDQRLDFMMNIYKEIIKNATSKLSELESEVNRRLQS